MSGRIRTEKADGLGWIVFDHEARRNAISAEMWQAIPDVVADMQRDSSVRVVVMRGAGDVAFVSGADISEFGGQRSGPQAEEYDRSNQQAFRALADLDKPLLASIHGFCVGGGCAIAIAADLRYAADDARFAIPAARLGLGYSALGLEMLVRVVGHAAAKEILFTARRFQADEALRMRLVNQVFAKTELDAAVREIATTIARNAPLTIRSAKRVLHELAKEPAARDRKAIDASIHACYASDDYAEGVRAFLEKRAPVFRGK